MSSSASPPLRAPDAPGPALAPAVPEHPIWRTVLALAWPTLLQNWLILTVSLSDRLLAGRFLSRSDVQTEVQAAQTTAIYLSWFLSSAAALVSTGSAALVARLTGAGDRRGARQVLHQALLLAATVGAACAVAGTAFLGPVLSLLNLSGVAAAEAAAYLRPLLYQLPAQMVGLAGIACLIGAGDTRTGMWVLGAVAAVNLPLTWLCFHGLGPVPPLGFVGIATGTAVAQTLGGLAVLLILYHGRAGLRLRLRQLRPRADVLVRLLRISVPAAADSLSMQVGYLWFLGIVNDLGNTAAAAHGIALAWEALGYQSGAAFGTAALAVVGQSLGAGRPDRAARAGWTAFALGAGLMTLMGAVFFTLATPMFAVFCPHPNQEPIVRAGVPVLRLVAFGMPALASCMVLASALRGAGDTRWPMYATWLGFFGIRIPLAYLLTREPGWSLGLFGAWLAMFADLLVRGLFVLWRFVGGRWKTVRV